MKLFFYISLLIFPNLVLAINIDLIKLNDELKSNYNKINKLSKLKSEHKEYFIQNSLGKKCYSVYLIDKAKNSDSLKKEKIMQEYAKFIYNFKKFETEKYKNKKMLVLTKEDYNSRLNLSLGRIREYCQKRYHP